MFHLISHIQFSTTTTHSNLVKKRMQDIARITPIDFDPDELLPQFLDADFYYWLYNNMYDMLYSKRWKVCDMARFVAPCLTFVYLFEQMGEELSYSNTVSAFYTLRLEFRVSYLRDRSSFTTLIVEEFGLTDSKGSTPTNLEITDAEGRVIDDYNVIPVYAGCVPRPEGYVEPIVEEIDVTEEEITVPPFSKSILYLMYIMALDYYKWLHSQVMSLI